MMQKGNKPLSAQFELFFDIARAQLIAKQWADAARTFEICVGLNPKSASAWANLAIAYFRQGRSLDAIKAAERSVEVDPNAYGGWVTLAESYMAAGELPEALAAAKRAEQLAPKEPIALGMQARVHGALGNYEDSLKAAKRAQRFAVHYDRLLHVLVADALRMLGKFKAALKEYGSIVEMADKPAFEIIGEDMISRALRGQGLTEYALSRTTKDQTHLEKAVNSFDAAVTRDPGDVRAWAGLGMVCRESWKLQRALDATERAISLGGRDPFLAFERGLSLFELGRYAEAIDDLAYASQGLVDERTRRRTAVEFHIASLQQAGRNEACIKAAGTAVAEGIASPVVLNARAHAWLATGEVDKAKADLKEALEKDPEDVVVALNLAFIALDESDVKTAEELAVQLEPTRLRNPSTTSGAYRLFRQLGRNENADRFIASIQSDLADEPELLRLCLDRIERADLEISYHVAAGRVAELENLISEHSTKRFEMRLNEFEALLANPNVGEEEIKQFLKADSSRFLFGLQAVRLHTEHELGSDFACDFVVEHVARRYLLVEIENVTHKLFTKAGTRAAALVKACQQVEDWQQWIEENNAYAQKKLPECVSPEGLVVLGRRASLSENDRQRLERSNVNLRGRMRIITYDDLIQEARAVIANLASSVQP